MLEMLKKNKKIRIIAIASGTGLFVFALLVILALSGLLDQKKHKEPANEPKPVVEATETQVPTEEEVSHEGQAKSPLTGLWIDEKKAALRPIAIMTENTKVTQPSYGTSQGDIYYECPMEGGLTRLMVLYQNVGKMKRIGNIRSARNYFIYFAREYDAIFMHCGYSHFAKELADSDFIDNINGITGKAEAFMFRTEDRKAPHNLYTSAKLLKASYKAYNYKRKRSKKTKDHFRFAQEDDLTELEGGQPARKVQIYYPVNKPWFKYDAKKGVYKRFQYGEKQMDGLKKKQLAVTNIIIQECEVRLWEEKTGYVYVDCTSGGKGKYITRGKCIDITWKKKKNTSVTRYYDASGNEITLNPGKTWIEIVDKKDSARHVIK